MNYLQIETSKYVSMLSIKAFVANSSSQMISFEVWSDWYNLIIIYENNKVIEM